MRGEGLARARRSRILLPWRPRVVLRLPRARAAALRDVASAGPGATGFATPKG